MNREEMLHELETKTTWDLLVIGGGATGLGVALEGASRGYRTLLLEGSDFGSGTSSRSTKRRNSPVWRRAISGMIRQ